MIEASTSREQVATPVAESTAPTPPQIMTTAHHWSDAHHSLFVLLEQSKTIAELLHFNYSGDGNFERPSEAPGVARIAQSVADHLVAAEAAANALPLAAATRNAIYDAAALATHLAAASEGTRLDGKLCFNYGDPFVGKCYAALRNHAERAIAELLSKSAA